MKKIFDAFNNFPYKMIILFGTLLGSALLKNWFDWTVLDWIISISGISLCALIIYWFVIGIINAIKED